MPLVMGIIIITSLPNSNTLDLYNKSHIRTRYYGVWKRRILSLGMCDSLEVSKIIIVATSTQYMTCIGRKKETTY